MLGAEVSKVDELGEVVLVEDAIKSRDDVLCLFLLKLVVLAEMVPELADEPENFLRGFDVLEEELIGEQVEDQKDACLVVAEGVNKIDEVLDRTFLICILLLVQHLPG